MKPHFYLIPRELENSYLSRHHTLPNLGSVWHYHPELELHYIIRGSGVRFIGNSINNFEAGELLLLGQNLPHMWRCTEEYFKNDPNITAEAIVIQFLPDFMGHDFLGKWEASKITDLYKRAKVGFEIIRETKDTIIDLMKQTVNSSGIKTIVLILTMIEILSKSRDLIPISPDYTVYQSSQEETDRLNQIISYTLNNYSDEISLHEISKVANLSITSFCRYFKMMTHRTFNNFLSEIRVSHSKRLLIEQNELTIESIGIECGFHSRSSFFRHFKAITGFTPNDYREQFNRGIIFNSTAN